MNAIERYHMFAGYNAWANGRLYTASAELADGDYRADRKAFFGSLHRTLNHLLVGDRIWMRRFTGEGETYDRLDLVLHDDLDSLWRAREAEDERIIAFARGLDARRLEAGFEYRRMDGGGYAQPLSTALDHFFNHQTHHRGQAHALVSAAGAKAPELDLLYYQRETGLSRAVEKAGG